MSTRARVALIRTTPETVLQDYGRVMELAEFRRYLDPSAATILRLDVRRHVPFPSANTPPWQLDGAARALRGAGYLDLACAGPSARPSSTFGGQDLNGYLPVLRAGGIAVRRAPAPAGARDDARSANVVLLPTLKTDGVTTIGGALRCAAGTLLPGRAHELLVAALARHLERRAGLFAVMDGTTAGNGLGPYRLAPEVRNVILASADPLALDAVVAKLMGFEPLRDVAYLRMAHEHGLGAGDPREIALVGDEDLARASWRFSATRRPHLALPRPLRACCARGPLARLLAVAAESYHDCYRWPIEERQVFESWLRGTQWGWLFARYQRVSKC